MDRLDRENELLEQIKSAPADANFVLAQRMALKGREMKLQGLCVSCIIQNRSIFAAQPNPFSILPGSLVQLLFSKTISQYEKEGLARKAAAAGTPPLAGSVPRQFYIITNEEWDREHRALVQQLLQTGGVTQIHMDVDRSTEMEFARWLISAAAVHCPRLDRLCVDTEFCLGQDGSCILDHTNRQRPHKYVIAMFPLERLQHLTRLTLRLEGTRKRGREGAAGLVRIVEALPQLLYLDCPQLLDDYDNLAAAFVALVQPLLQQNQRVLEVKSMTLDLPGLQVDFSTNLRVQKLTLYGMDEAHLSRLRHLSGVRTLRVLHTDLQAFYSLVELLGPRGLKNLVFSHPRSHDVSGAKILRLVAAAPALSSMEIGVMGFANAEVVASATDAQLRAADFAKMRRFLVKNCKTGFSLCNYFPYLEQFVLRAESLEELYLEGPEQVQLVLRLLKTHPECCSRVQKLSIYLSREEVMINFDATVEVATRIALRSRTLNEILVFGKYGWGEDVYESKTLDRHFPWFKPLLSSNGIRLFHQRPPYVNIM